MIVSALTALVASLRVEAVILSAVIELLTGAGGRTGIIFENQTINIASIALLTNNKKGAGVSL